MPGQNHEVYRFGRFCLSPSRHALYLGEAEIPLAPKSFEVLLYLARNPGRLIPKEELLQAVWADAFVEEANLAQHIFRLRKAFETEPGAANLICTMPGRGYQFTAEVSLGSLSAVVPNGIGGDLSAETASGLVEGGYSIERWRERTHMVVEEMAVPRKAALTRATRILLPAAVPVIAVLGTLGAWRWHMRVAPIDYRQVVLADFTNTTGDAAFDRTLRRALEVDLEQSPFLDVMSERAGVGTLQMMGRNGDTPMTADVAREVCERTNRKILIEGSISNIGPEYLVTLEATDCGTGKSLTSAKAEAKDEGQVLAAVDVAAAQMRSGLGESAKSLASYQVPLREATTPSLEALKAYSMGKYLSAQGRPDTECRPFFERAVELDPHFAVAYGELSAIYYNNNDMATAKQYMVKAYQEKDHVTAKERVMIEAHYYDQGMGDLPRANAAYQVWGETYPDDWVPWVDIANNDNQLGLYQQAIPVGERALQLGPERTINYNVLMRAYTAAGRYADAKQVYQLAMQRKKDSTGINEFRYNIAYMEHDTKTIAETDAWMGAHPEDWYYVDRKAESAAASGRYKEAVNLFRQAYDITKQEKFDDSADGIVIDQAQVETWFGLDSTARATLSRLSTDSADGRDLVLIRTQLGDKTAAARFLATTNKDEPGTLMKYLSLPQARAAAAAEQGKPLEAIAYLEPAQLYELESYSVPTQLAELYLRTKQAGHAVEQYKKILANPGIDPVCPQVPLAHLGLARAYAMQNDKTESRREYEAFFYVWKDADPDLPVLRQAHAEYALLH